jgi:hypothetical protein
MSTDVLGFPKPDLDFSFDIEIAGTPVANRRYNGTCNGAWQDVLSPASGKRLEIYKAFLSVSGDVTGEIQLRIGTNVLSGIQNPKGGGYYIFLSCFPDFELGGVDAKLQVLGPSGASIIINYSYNEVG